MSTKLLDAEPRRYRANLGHETDLSQRISGAIEKARTQGRVDLAKKLEGYLVSPNLPPREDGEAWDLITEQESSVHID
jgi:hypothetical protein